MKEPVDALEKHTRTVSAIVEDFVWYTYRLCVRFGINGHDHTDKILAGWRTMDWVRWIIDMVAYRQRKDDDIGTIVLHEAMEAVPFEPRSKRNGSLIQVTAE